MFFYSSCMFSSSLTLLFSIIFIHISHSFFPDAALRKAATGHLQTSEASYDDVGGEPLSVDAPAPSK